jgi:DeoR/GlpR family transcriptional regulator of sugar metabolism
MLIVERHQRLLEILRSEGSAALEDLASRLAVSVSTVRRDLDALETQGLLQRTHGGAVLREPSGITGANGTGGRGAFPDAFAARMTEQVQAKRAIGRHAASLVEPNMTLLMDAGSTVVYAAQQITVRPIQIVTTSLAIATHFANDEQVEITVVGGQLYPRTSAMVGAIARAALKELYADLCFMSLASIDESAGYNLNREQTRVEQVMLDQADTTVLLMDASKFGRRSLVKVCEIGRFNGIIADGRVDPYWDERFGDRLIVAPG